MNESERPLYLALLFGAHKMNQNSDNLSKASSAIAGDNSKAVTGHSNSTPLMKHVFVLEENEQPDIQVNRKGLVYRRLFHQFCLHKTQ